MDPSVLSLAERLIRPEMVQRDQQLANDTRHIIERMATRGIVNSSIHLHEIEELCIRDVAARAQIIFTQLLRALTTVGGPPNPELAVSLQRAFDDLLDRYSTQPLEQYTNTLRSNPGSPAGDPVADANERAKEKFGAEIEVNITSMLRAHAASGGTVVNVTGTVGAVLTGAGASAVVNQSIAPGDFERLRTSLLEVRDLLLASSNLTPQIRDDLPDLVDEAVAELENPNPNLTRVRAVAGAVATSLQTVGALQPAYALLRVALMPFGVTLP